MITIDTGTPVRTSDRYIPALLLLPPLLAVIGGFITLYLVVTRPDREITVETVSRIQDGPTVHQHVVNSVTPPLK